MNSFKKKTINYISKVYDKKLQPLETTKKSNFKNLKITLISQENINLRFRCMKIRNVHLWSKETKYNNKCCVNFTIFLSKKRLKISPFFLTTYYTLLSTIMLFYFCFSFWWVSWLEYFWVVSLSWWWFCFSGDLPCCSGTE